MAAKYLYFGALMGTMESIVSAWKFGPFIWLFVNSMCEIKKVNKYMILKDRDLMTFL